MTQQNQIDLNELVALAGGPTVRKSVIQAIKMLDAIPEAGYPFFGKAIKGLGDWNAFAEWLDMPDQHGMSPAEYVLTSKRLDDVYRLLDNFLATGNQELPKHRTGV